MRPLGARGRKACFILFALLLLTGLTWGLLWLDSQTPRLKSGSKLPLDAAARSYALWGFTEEADGYGFTLTGVDPADITGSALVLADVGDFELYCNGTLLYSCKANDAYKRILIVDLKEAVPQAGEMTFRILTQSPIVVQDGPFKRMITFAPKLLLSPLNMAQEYAQLAFGGSMLALGMYLILILSCLSLYLKKRSETYLLLLSIVAITLLIITLFNLDLPFFYPTQGIYTSIRPLLHLAPVIMNDGICLYLFKDAVPARLRKWVRPQAILLETLAAMGLQSLIANTLNLIWPVRLLLFVPVLYTLATAHVKKQPGAAAITVIYQFNFATSLFICFLGLHQMGYGVLRVFLRTSQLGYLFYLVACMVLIDLRFAGKFAEADYLVKVLDKKVEERTMQLAEAQEHKHKLMTNIFHDLRSPVFSLRGYVDILESKPGRMFEMLPVMRERLDFLKRLIEDLFLIAKLEDRAITFEMNELDMAALCERTVDAHQAAAAEKSLALTLQSTPSLVIGDEYRLQRVLQELLDNALLYTPAGGKVTLSVIPEGNNICLRVADTGAGIPPEDLPRVFERYYRSSRTDDRRSSGLGLSIAREIVLLHGGSIHVASTMGGGTVFTVLLPDVETFELVEGIRTIT